LIFRPDQIEPTLVLDYVQYTWQILKRPFLI
jgi:hypothetical protein